MRRLISSFLAAIILVPVGAEAASKPNANVRALLPAVNVAAKPKFKARHGGQQFLVVRMKEVMVTGVSHPSAKPNPGKMNFEHYFDTASP